MLVGIFFLFIYFFSPTLRCHSFVSQALGDLLQRLLDLSLAKLDRKKLWHIIIKKMINKEKEEK